MTTTATTPSRHAGETNKTWALIALAIGAFGIGTNEFSPMGLLPVIAKGVDVSIPTAGLLVSAYALGVMIGAPLMTIALNRYPKRLALMVLMGLFTIGNVWSALAPGYDMLMIGRIVASLNHGAFFGIGSVLAASLVPRERQAAAVATMFMGLTIANIGGVPAASWLGQHIGWRESFFAIGMLGVVTIGALALALPAGKPGPVPEIRKELAVLTRPEVLLALGTTVMGASSMFTLYTYATDLLEKISGASGGMVTLALALVGVGFTIGNWVGGRLAAWSLDGAVVIFLVAQGAILIAMPLLLPHPVLAIAGLVLWGIPAFAICSPVQTRVMHAAEDAPALAASVNIGAFNMGNALGAAVGGGVLAAGLGESSVPVAGGVLALLGLVLVWLGRRSPAWMA